MPAHCCQTYWGLGLARYRVILQSDVLEALSWRYLSAFRRRLTVAHSRKMRVLRDDYSIAHRVMILCPIAHRSARNTSSLWRGKSDSRS